eukprot:CAMPEP_0206377538 /NCGR_PEP_ID=MMETSP0294-20121207/10225_1 /ASSEMBLY_ACC=CAM_ASM_000327 /TAXON_ID=39354 /ORGANISM="Heterosigma akashiwo, Strain CCMP2393" /LENGTH=304 /DNA_ID=CAMNT_0053826049 /DNA_START=294 /DNA_END=1204 /DNA_ORIENTATION=-
MTDCSEALVKIKMAFRPGVVDLPSGASEAPAAAINVANFGEFDMYMDMAMPLSFDDIPAADQWMAAASQTITRRQDITMPDSQQSISVNLEESNSFRLPDDGMEWTTFVPEEVPGIEISMAPLEATNDSPEVSRALGRESDVSEIEGARKAEDLSYLRSQRLKEAGRVSFGEAAEISPKDGLEEEDGPQFLPEDLDENMQPQVDYGPEFDGGGGADFEPSEEPPAAAAARGRESTLSAAAAPSLGDALDSSIQEGEDKASETSMLGDEEETIRPQRGKKRRLVLDETTEVAGAVIRKQLDDPSA